MKIKEARSQVPVGAVATATPQATPTHPVETLAEGECGDTAGVTSSAESCSRGDSSEPCDRLTPGAQSPVEVQQEAVANPSAPPATVSGLAAEPSHQEPAPTATPEARKRKKRPEPTSQKKIEANRENAKKSTGPKTDEGKARSSSNALKHGILCGSLLAYRVEDAPALTELKDDFMLNFQPATREEQLYVEVIIECVWRHRRVLRYEAALIESNTILGRTFYGWREKEENSELFWKIRREADISLSLIRPLDQGLLLRYDVQIDRKLAWALGQLRDAQERRKAQEHSKTAALHLPGGYEIEGEE